MVAVESNSRNTLKDRYILIPVEMCSFALSQKFIRPCQLYIYLKSKCSGKIILHKKDLKLIAETLGLSSGRTIQNNLKILRQANWIGYNPKTNIYFIRSFDCVRTQHGFISRSCAEFDKREIKQFKAFLAGAIISNLVNSQRRGKWITERQKGRSNQIIRQPSVYFPVANLALAKVLNVSISTAFEFKKLAHKAGYIKLEKNFKDTRVNPKFAKAYKRNYSEIAHKIKFHQGKLMIQGIDTVFPCVRFKRRKKIETYIKGNSNFKTLDTSL